ncbi:MAG: vWA domain-containing protein [Cetobacterium sp.]|uniref:vWA domain-containing protein n=1 Tax=Cetobacterium sp. TaxID=2071632 RepID=UPI003EE5A98C
MDIRKVVEMAEVDLFAKPKTAFITSLFCGLSMVIDEKHQTAATDGKSIFVNPQWFSELSRQMRVTVFAHEVWHVALKHNLRKGNRDPEVWNYACDFYINNMLIEAGFVMEMGLSDSKYNGMSEEEIYEQLLQSGEKPEKSFGDVLLMPGDGQMAQEIEANTDSLLIRAAIAAKQSGQAGTVPGHIELYLDSLLNPKLPWEVILRDFFSEMAKVDYTWKRPNKRFFPDYYLPSLGGNTLGHVMFYLDISGSVSDAQFKVYASEIDTIIKQFRPAKVSVVTFDTRIHDEYELTPQDEITDLKFHGRGGTSLDCVHEHATKHKPQIMVVFSDLDCRKMEVEPMAKVIWVCLDNPSAQVNFGNLIHVNS